MLSDEPTRNRVFARLKAAGWISEASVLTDDKTPNQFSYSVKWTDYGKQRRRQFHSIIEELGFASGPHWGGETEATFDLCRISPYEHMGQSGEAPPENPRL
jgi:hypothetical protein